MTLTFYGLKTCDTCRKAQKALAAAGHELSVVDVRADGVPRAVLSGWLKLLGPGPLVNTRSTTWRGLTEAERAGAQTLAGVEALLCAHPTLIKRPVIVAGDQVHIGWTAAVQKALLPG
ncbi:MAG: ArsC/Spx/MgsR family protein [Pseudomonadota bacterium]